MTKKKDNLYDKAHLVVAAIRLLEYRDNMPPSTDSVCQKLSFSLEQGNLICKKLHDRKIIEIIEGAFGSKIYIRDHLLIEEIPKDHQEKTIEDEVKEFQKAQKENLKKIQSLHAEQKKKRKDLFAEIDRQLKNGLKKT